LRGGGAGRERGGLPPLFRSVAESDPLRGSPRAVEPGVGQDFEQGRGRVEGGGMLPVTPRTARRTRGESGGIRVGNSLLCPETRDLAL